MKFYIFTYKCVNKYNFNCLIHILPGIIAYYWNYCREIYVRKELAVTENTLKQLLVISN